MRVTEQPVKVQTLVCLGKLMPSLESWMIAEQIIPTLPNINSKEPGILMAILGIYKLAFEMEQSPLSREQCAKNVLPFLMSTSVENTLNLNQFEQYIALSKKVLAKVEAEQRSRLQQLSASQEEQRDIKDFNAVLEQKNAKEVQRNFDGLVDLPSSDVPHYGGSTPTNGGAAFKSGPLSLEEKKRLAAEQEANLKIRAQPSLITSKTANSSAPSLKDLSLGAKPSQPPTRASNVDISSFLPPPSTSSFPVSRPQPPPNPSNFQISTNSLMFPTTAAFNTAPSNSVSGLDSLFTSSAGSGILPQKLSQPPLVSNPVNRGFQAKPAASSGKMDLSVFDSLIAFPSSQNTSRGSGAPPMNAMQKNVPGGVIRPNSATSKPRDPFDDLLG
ncbi:hypothetical protein L596_014701 [Steinernema carpocapsae]|uniref:SCY1-like protein 2 n=1 Tax=Steinernema carpocapsae TaxID=34508 RepID=A0A4U5NDG7_STECR|nr:hypothetical protein L596_014701 [Steinernema carpocapsae]